MAQLRWSVKDQKAAKSTSAEPLSDQMKLMEFAFRMGQTSSGSGSASPRPVEPSQSPFPLLAIADGSAEDICSYQVLGGLENAPGSSCLGSLVASGVPAFQVAAVSPLQFQLGLPGPDSEDVA